MRITELSLANFRSFRTEQTIDFAPLTLLFGPNSVGKSTILMALFYVQQILAKGQCDPQRLDAMGERFVGGFKHLVHGKRLDESLRIRIQYDMEGSLSSSYSEVGEIVMREMGPVAELLGLANMTPRMSVDLEVSWSNSHNTAYVSRYVVSYAAIELAEITSDPGLRQPMITRLNYQHELLDHEGLREWVLEQVEQGHAIHPSLTNYLELEDHGQDIAPELSENAFQSHFHELIQVQPMETFLQMDGSEVAQRPVDHDVVKTIGIEGFSGALPKLGKVLHTNLEVDDDRLNRVLEEIMSDIVVAPLDNLLKLLNESLCIGPLRHISDPTYKPNSFPQQKDWYSGRACWDILGSGDPERDTAVNEWLAGQDKLNLGYKLVYKFKEGSSKYISPSNSKHTLEALYISEEIGDSLNVTSPEEDLDDPKGAERFEAYKEMMEKWRDKASFISELYIGEHQFKELTIALWDCKNEIEVTASDIGVGVSQLLPLVVAAVSERNGLVACEQPELHIHPRIQVAVGDMLLQTRNERNFLIETHSEHLILRLLRRVRETTENRLPAGLDPVSPDDISIIYLEPSDSGVSVRHINIDEDGEFTSRWPQGFFAERREELL